MENMMEFTLLLTIIPLMLMNDDDDAYGHLPSMWLTLSHVVSMEVILAMMVFW